MNCSLLGYLIAALIVLAVLCGCGPKGQNHSRAEDREPVLILAAASTRDALGELARDFTKDTGIKINIADGDSSSLATQIVNGAPADLFLSANEQWANFVKKDFADRSVPLLGNTLVLVTPQGNPAKLQIPADLTRPGVKRVAVAGPSVPAGIYAKQALTHLHVWDELQKQGKIAPCDNVRATLTFVERGEVEAGIVYATDAAVSTRVDSVYTFKATAHDKIVYPLVLLKNGSKRDSALRFFEYLQSAAASGVYEKHGFIVLGGN